MSDQNAMKHHIFAALCIITVLYCIFYSSEVGFNIYSNDGTNLFICFRELICKRAVEMLDVLIKDFGGNRI